LATFQGGTSRGQTLESGPAYAIGVESRLEYRKSESESPITFPSLPSVEVEIVQTSSYYSDIGQECIILFDKEAHKEEKIEKQPSLEAVVIALKSASSAHFCCHGYFDISSPMDSGLLLRNYEGKTQILSIKDINNLKFAPKYVAMSACYSADCLALPGRRPISLPHTFLRVGTREVLAAFWPIVDISVPEFFHYYNSRLSSEQCSVALAQAQRAAIKGDILNADQRYRVPFYWASYVIFKRFSHDIW
jgi:CHAT domain-containing protein